MTAGVNRVYTIHTVGSDATWSRPEALPVARRRNCR